MKKILFLQITILAFFCMACVYEEEQKCNEPLTYRPEIGIGYVFQETDSGLVPVAGAKITVENVRSEGGLKGKTIYLAKKTYTTDADGCYQVKFVEKGCHNNTMVYCNLYRFYYENNSFRTFGFYDEYIDINAQNNILMLDTIKLYK